MYPSFSKRPGPPQTIVLKPRAGRISVFRLTIYSLALLILLNMAQLGFAQSPAATPTGERANSNQSDQTNQPDLTTGNPSLPTQPNATNSGLEISLTSEQIFRAMKLTSKAFRIAEEKIRPALVTIESYGGSGTQQGRIGGIRKQGEGNTTGIMISPDGYVLTSTFNFIQQPPFFSVIPSDGKRRLARIVGRDDTRKICLLKIDDVQNLPVPEMVPLEEIVGGQWAISLGVGYGDQRPAMSVGIISAKNRIGGRAIQTDANISPANYGGALIDIRGRLLGICVPMNPQSQAVGAGVDWYDSGIGFAIPLAEAEPIIERLKAGETISPAFLGVQPGSNADGTGLRIEKVVPNSPAADAKLGEGDIMLGIDQEVINDMLRLRQVLNRFEAGQKIKVKIIKSSKKKTKADQDESELTASDSEPIEVEITLGVAPKPAGEPETLEPPKIR